ncbi:hypothetical protein N866_13085 [Actinotalea ferrariae CF5-4]|uniref:Uncharacterized protein n=1 Tax=Actinotalea ferrariae CF5-4 TaxID=948458 RepID=A0A021VVF2_9CELL|nr:hypothetical protein [Actinotalea ferrariae]EYR65141.1 hypothetical protein N866_13085 [Actinotalea ferrariae CF5-4]
MRFEARLRVPAAIDDGVAGPYVDLLLQHPDDGEVVARDGDAEEGSVRIAFEADEQADADLHARLLAERAPGVEVRDVVPA